jgi:hypothetical protein
MARTQVKTNASYWRRRYAKKIEDLKKVREAYALQLRENHRLKRKVTKLQDRLFKKTGKRY